MIKKINVIEAKTGENNKNKDICEERRDEWDDVIGKGTRIGSKERKGNRRNRKREKIGNKCV